MLSNYLKLALRNLFKNKLHSGINILGLAIGFAASIVIFLYSYNELTYDAFNHNAESTYLIYKERITPTGTQITRDTWLPMAGALKQEYPAIKYATRYFEDEAWVQLGDKKFRDQVAYVDAEFFDIFSLPLVEGELTAFASDIHSAFVTPEIAAKYFGDANPLGKTITVDYQTDYVIRGVLQSIPQNASVEFGIALPIRGTPWYERNKDNWDGSFLYTFLQLEAGTLPASLEAQFSGFVTKIWDAELNKSLNLKLLPLLILHDELTGANQYAYILLGVAMAILMIAFINFVNLTTARSLDRAREIGLRKVLGAFRLQLIRQFLIESIVLSVSALCVAVLMVELFLPGFNALYDLQVGIDYVGSSSSLALLGSALLVGTLAGIYPAFVISKYQPVKSLKGELRTSPGSLRLRSTMVTTQFALAIILIFGTVVMWQQVQYMRHANLNFDKENVVTIQVRQADFEDREEAGVKLEAFKNQLLQHSAITDLTSSTHIPADWSGWFIFAYPTDRDESQRLRVRRAFVDEAFFPTFGIDLVEGRNFSADYSTESEESMLINQAALRDLGWNTAKDRQIRVGSTVYNVVGVVQDFHFQSLAAEVAPVMFFYRPPDDDVHRFISVKLAAGNLAAPLEYMKEQWRALDPTRPFEFSFMDDNLDRLYDNETRLTTVTGYFAVLAIFIACLGLFALASLLITQRKKEIGIRKTLGATVPNIIFLVTKRFTRLVIVAFILACPLAYFAASRWLADFSYRISLNWSLFAMAGILALVIAFLTLSYHSVKAALTNPVDSLRYE